MNSYRICLRLAQADNSLTYRPTSLFEKLPNHSSPDRAVQTATALESSAGKTTNDWRFGSIKIDWIDKAMSSVGNSGLSVLENDATSQRRPATAQFIQNSPEQAGSIDIPEGILHIYRDTLSSGCEPSASTTPALAETPHDATILAVLAVPSHMTPSDFLTFVAPAAESMAHLRMIRDSSPNRSVVVIKFRTTEEAKDFSQEYNGRPFNAMEPEICHVVNILSVEIEANDATSLAISRLTTAQGNTYELPTCPVCLERMDAAVTGLVTVPCSHTFHCMCLSKWGDSRCPVCRYSQTLLSSHPSSSGARRTPFTNSGPSLSVCFDCSSTTNLWICLICGNVGCGRYGRAHAHAHYELTTHLYALELETQRVWDYAGDGYVHRLIQNKADGKLVELPSASSMTAADGVGSRLGPGPTDTMNAEKIEAIGIEYSYLLTSQLDSQREHYEEQKTHLERLLMAARDKIEALEGEIHEHAEIRRNEDERRNHEEEMRRTELVKERLKAEKRADKLADMARTFEKELKEERAVSEGLMKNLAIVRERADRADKERASFDLRMKDMEEQVRDVMIFLDAKDKIQGEGGIEEAIGGTVELLPPKSGKGKKRTKK
ncbi:zf-UBP-domain-containing protein [Ramaria rubella]|nr:zf-UBP-domain-containing protein [Ramaria rubella]